MMLHRHIVHRLLVLLLVYDSGLGATSSKDGGPLTDDASKEVGHSRDFAGGVVQQKPDLEETDQYPHIVPLVYKGKVIVDEKLRFKPYEITEYYTEKDLNIQLHINDPEKIENAKKSFNEKLALKVSKNSIDEPGKIVRPTFSRITETLDEIFPENAPFYPLQAISVMVDLGIPLTPVAEEIISWQYQPKETYLTVFEQSNTVLELIDAFERFNSAKAPRIAHELLREYFLNVQHPRDAFHYLLSTGQLYGLIKDGQATFTDDFVPSKLSNVHHFKDSRFLEQLEYLELDRRLFLFLDSFEASKDLKGYIAQFIEKNKQKGTLHIGRILLELVAKGKIPESRTYRDLWSNQPSYDAILDAIDVAKAMHRPEKEIKKLHELLIDCYARGIKMLPTTKPYAVREPLDIEAAENFFGAALYISETTKSDDFFKKALQSNRIRDSEKGLILAGMLMNGKSDSASKLKFPPDVLLSAKQFFQAKGLTSYTEYISRFQLKAAADVNTVLQCLESAESVNNIIGDLKQAGMEKQVKTILGVLEESGPELGMMRLKYIYPPPKTKSEMEKIKRKWAAERNPSNYLKGTQITLMSLLREPSKESTKWIEDLLKDGIKREKEELIKKSTLYNHGPEPNTWIISKVAGTIPEFRIRRVHGDVLAEVMNAMITEGVSLKIVFDEIVDWHPDEQRPEEAKASYIARLLTQIQDQQEVILKSRLSLAVVQEMLQSALPEKTKALILVSLLKSGAWDSLKKETQAVIPVPSNIVDEALTLGNKNVDELLKKVKRGPELKVEAPIQKLSGMQRFLHQVEKMELLKIDDYKNLFGEALSLKLFLDALVQAQEMEKLDNGVVLDGLVELYPTTISLDIPLVTEKVGDLKKLVCANSHDCRHLGPLMQILEDERIEPETKTRLINSALPNKSVPIEERGKLLATLVKTRFLNGSIEKSKLAGFKKNIFSKPISKVFVSAREISDRVGQKGLLMMLSMLQFEAGDTLSEATKDMPPTYRSLFMTQLPKEAFPYIIEVLLADGPIEDLPVAEKEFHGKITFDGLVKILAKTEDEDTVRNIVKTLVKAAEQNYLAPEDDYEVAEYVCSASIERVRRLLRSVFIRLSRVPSRSLTLLLKYTLIPGASVLTAKQISALHFTLITTPALNGNNDLYRMILIQPNLMANSLRKLKDVGQQVKELVVKTLFDDEDAELDNEEETVDAYAAAIGGQLFADANNLLKHGAAPYLDSIAVSSDDVKVQQMVKEAKKELDIVQMNDVEEVEADQLVDHVEPGDVDAEPKGSYDPPQPIPRQHGKMGRAKSAPAWLEGEHRRKKLLEAQEVPVVPAPVKQPADVDVSDVIVSEVDKKPDNVAVVDKKPADVVKQPADVQEPLLTSAGKSVPDTFPTVLVNPVPQSTVPPPQLTTAGKTGIVPSANTVGPIVYTGPLVQLKQASQRRKVIAGKIYTASSSSSSSSSSKKHIYVPNTTHITRTIPATSRLVELRKRELERAKRIAYITSFVVILGFSYLGYGMYHIAAFDAPVY